MELQIIQVGSPEYNAVIEAAVISGINAARKMLKDEEDLLTQEEAMELLRVKSKAKMKQIRETSGMVSKKLGGEFRYSKKSILAWMNK